MKTIRRRRREAKTDYNSRFTLLKSEKPRIVIRKTNKHIIVQIVRSDIAKDKVIATANSAELLTKGWPKESAGSLKSLAAAYLTGALIAKKVEGKIKEAILDSGLNRNIHGSRIYAALKGAIDSGLKIPHQEDCLPDMERIKTSSKVGSQIDKIKEKL